MKKRILIVVVFLVSLLSLSWAEDGVVFFAPAPPESTLKDTKKMKMDMLNISVYLYSSAQSPDRIARFYQDYLGQKGFKVINEMFDKAKHLIRFKKDTQVVSIAINPKAPDTEVILAEYIQPEGAPDPEQAKPKWSDFMEMLPEKDQPGEDFQFLPRPPEGVRLASVNDKGKYYITYSAKASAQETKEFYKEQMKIQGWEIESEQNMMGTLKSLGDTKDFNKRLPPLPFPDITMQQMLEGAFVLKFKGDWGKTTLNIFNNPSPTKNVGCLVQIQYDKE